MTLLLSTDDDDLATVTVTIDIDDDVSLLEDDENGYAVTPHPSDDLFIIGEPPSPKEACPLPPARFKLWHLAPHVIHMLSNRLEAPLIGTMRNWEFIAALLGLSISEICAIRSKSTKPVQQLINQVSSVDLARFINVVGEAGRIDVLLGLRSFIEELLTASDVAVSNNTSLMSYDSALQTTSFGRGRSVFTRPERKFLLVTHYESSKVSVEEKKYFRWFYKNLVNAANSSNLDVIDIVKQYDESNLMSSTEWLFSRALQIILFCTSEYKSSIAENFEATGQQNPVTLVVRQLHHLMADEVLHNGFCNRRFRVVVPQGFSTDGLPFGWSRNTIVFQFPDHFVEFCEKYLNVEKNGISS